MGLATRREVRLEQQGGREMARSGRTYFAYTSDLGGFKPCPFCGRTEQEVLKTQQVCAKNHDSISFRIRCPCGCALDFGVYCYGKPDENMDESKVKKKLLKRIQEIWNERKQC